MFHGPVSRCSPWFRFSKPHHRSKKFKKTKDRFYEALIFARCDSRSLSPISPVGVAPGMISIVEQPLRPNQQSSDHDLFDLFDFTKVIK
jgi:hypothetical protein